MSATIVNLKDELGNTMYPQTKTNAVLDSNNVDVDTKLNDMQTYINNTISVQALVNLIYPIGSYFITESSDYDTVAKVQSHFGGTWVRVTGRFLYDNNGTAGQTGGSNDAIVVSHSHTFSGNNATGSFSIRGASNGASYPDQNSSTSGVFSKGNTGSRHYILTGTSSQYNTGLDSINFSMTPSGSISTQGDSGTNANMPAYRTVYMYRRTA